MTSVPTTGRADLAEVRRLLSTGLGWGFFAVGWLLAKACRLLVTVIGAVLFGAGWLAGRVAFAAAWTWAAFCLGWDAGRQPMGGRRGTG